MNRTPIIFILLLIPLVSFSQRGYKGNKTNGKYSHEIKYNFFYLIGLNTSEIAYELNLHKTNASVGSSALVTNYEEESIYFIWRGFYKKYIGQKKCYGFYIEGHSLMLVGNPYYEGLKTDLGFGLALGGKFIRNKRWTLDMTFGLGRLLNNNFDNYFPNLYPLGGVFIGYRLN